MLWMIILRTVIHFYFIISIVGIYFMRIWIHKCAISPVLMTLFNNIYIMMNWECPKDAQGACSVKMCMLQRGMCTVAVWHRTFDPRRTSALLCTARTSGVHSKDICSAKTRLRCVEKSIPCNTFLHTLFTNFKSTATSTNFLKLSLESSESYLSNWHL